MLIRFVKARCAVSAASAASAQAMCWSWLRMLPVLRALQRRARWSGVRPGPVYKRQTETGDRLEDSSKMLQDSIKLHHIKVTLWYKRAVL